MSKQVDCHQSTIVINNDALDCLSNALEGIQPFESRINPTAQPHWFDVVHNHTDSTQVPRT